MARLRPWLRARWASRSIGYPFSMASKHGKPATPVAGRSVREAEPGPELLPAPSPAAQDQIRAHLADAHGIVPFELDRHVHLGGPRSESQLVSWNPAKASYLCRLCPDDVFWTGEWTDEMIESRIRSDATVQAHLVGLTDPAERREMALHVLRGDAAQQRLAQSRRTSTRQRRPRTRRPTVEAQRAPVQAWLLARVGEHGVIAEAFRQAVRMQSRDREGWLNLCGKWPVPPETLKSWWYEIDRSERDAAVAAGQAGQAARAAKKSTM